jgi:cytochrome b561
MTETVIKDTGRYTGVAIALHWVIAALLVSLILYGWALEDQRETIASYDEFLEVKSGFNWHKTGGLLVLALSLLRLFWRFTHPVPPLPAGMKAWERVAARVTHIGFYVFMIGLPIGGYVVASAYGAEQPILLFDAIELPKLPVPQTEAFQSFAGSMHSAGAWALIVLAAVHIAAAMKHEFVKNDGVLARMIPIIR